MATEMGITDAEINLITDSLATINALKKKMTTSSVLLDCHNKLKALAENNHVLLSWTRGHSTCSGNLAADGLARKAGNSRMLGPLPGLPLSAATFKHYKNLYITHNHKIRWDSLQSCRHARKVLTAPSQELAEDCLNLSRNQLRILTGIYTGHFGLKKHLHTIGTGTDPICRGCNEEEETMEHILCDCPSLLQFRRTILGNYSASLEDIGRCPPRRLLSFFEKVGWLEE